MLQYQVKDLSNWKAIALLHAESWQVHYRGMCPDEYLDDKLLPNRLKVWEERSHVFSNQHILITAEDNALAEKDRLIGFSFIYLDKHDIYGAYLDNLHVKSSQQGLGIGKKLMQLSFIETRKVRPNSDLYLHVLAQNISAIKFYEKINGINLGQTEFAMPWGGKNKVVDFLWKQPIT